LVLDIGTPWGAAASAAELFLPLVMWATSVKIVPIADIITPFASTEPTASKVAGCRQISIARSMAR
jgi:hypothetical protein